MKRVIRHKHGITELISQMKFIRDTAVNQASKIKEQIANNAVEDDNIRSRTAQNDIENQKHTHPSVDRPTRNEKRRESCASNNRTHPQTQLIYHNITMRI